MTGTAVREMDNGDVEQVVALWRESGVARPWNEPAADIAFARRGRHSAILVAPADGRIAATAVVGEDGRRGWVQHCVATEPAHRGGGPGRAIMDAAEAWLAGRGVWKVQLLVREDNAEARLFCEHLGYRDTRSVCLQKIVESSV